MLDGANVWSKISTLNMFKVVGCTVKSCQDYYSCSQRFGPKGSMSSSGGWLISMRDPYWHWGRGVLERWESRWCSFWERREKRERKRSPDQTLCEDAVSLSLKRGLMRYLSNEVLTMKSHRPFIALQCTLALRSQVWLLNFFFHLLSHRSVNVLEQRL